jgi:hypothetical protein
MLPPIRGGGDGWFKLKSLVTTDRKITASVAVTAARLAADEALGGQLGTMAVDAVSQAATGGGVGVGTAIQAARRMDIAA